MARNGLGCFEVIKNGLGGSGRMAEMVWETSDQKWQKWSWRHLVWEALKLRKMVWEAPEMIWEAPK